MRLSCTSGAVSHGANKDCVGIVHVGHKNIVHIFEGVYGEGTYEIGIHGAVIFVSNGCTDKHVVCSACLLSWVHVGEFFPGVDNVLSVTSRGLCTLMYTLHISFGGRSGLRQMF